MKTAKEMGWSQLKNGDLLRVAEDQKFALIITCDQTSLISKTSPAEK